VGRPHRESEKEDLGAQTAVASAVLQRLEVKMSLKPFLQIPGEEMLEAGS